MEDVLHERNVAWKTRYMKDVLHERRVTWKWQIDLAWKKNIIEECFEMHSAYGTRPRKNEWHCTELANWYLNCRNFTARCCSRCVRFGQWMFSSLLERDPPDFSQLVRNIPDSNDPRIDIGPTSMRRHWCRSDNNPKCFAFWCLPHVANARSVSANAPAAPYLKLQGSQPPQI